MSDRDDRPLVLPAARGAEPTRDEPAPLVPEAVADLVRPVVPPDVVDALVAGLVDAVLAELDPIPGGIAGQSPAPPSGPEVASEPAAPRPRRP